MSHFSKSISQITLFWFLGVRVILRWKLGLYAGVRFWRNFLLRCGVQPYRDYTGVFCFLVCFFAFSVFFLVFFSVFF